MVRTAAVDLGSKISAITDEVKKLVAESQVSAEQLSYLQEVADEAETRMVVSQTPLADRTFAEAKADLERHRRYHNGLHARIEELGRQRDELLERMYRTRSS